MASPTIQVSETPAQASSRAARQKLGKPSHWVHDKPTQFVNPWPSFRPHTTRDFALGASFTTMASGPSKASIVQIPIQKPTWGANLVAENAHKIKATWLGHACFLVELPSSTTGVRGARILFDPVFSDRCSPTQLLGPRRFTRKSPSSFDAFDVPEIDAIVISHNHYDQCHGHHLPHQPARRTPAPHVFAPLGNEAYFHSLGVPEERTHCLDWWDARRVRSASPVHGTLEFDVTFTPGQHFTGRGILDRFKSLWGGWVVEGVPAASASAVPPRVYFAGDTGYRSVPSSTDDGPETLPVCPAFKEIGARWGGFDLALIPIGAYAPRRFMSPIHCAPRDSVALFRDIKARRALGMHWGAWVLTTEDILEPPLRLAEECAKAGVAAGAFGVCAIGETVSVEVGGEGGKGCERGKGTAAATDRDGLPR
ncbi:beta-lactamase superfamily domain-containing protein [Mycena rosella]|uniref:Beta-lactamase superfamily domain-containing protein n=1 Tax=Mycena rosella TaxID=1033263 RepID=A0AAD7FTX5_MYCRO|nr:beta-lactamase superfamily domain-containing protein [Mycena rosella]